MWQKLCIYTLAHWIPILHLAAQKNNIQMGVARRPVSSQVLVRTKPERSDWPRLELRNAKQKKFGRRKNGVLPDQIGLERYVWLEKNAFNVAAKLFVLCSSYSSRYIHVTPLLRQLPWLKQIRRTEVITEYYYWPAQWTSIVLLAGVCRRL